MFNKLFLIIIVTIKPLIPFSQQPNYIGDTNNEVISPLGVHIVMIFNNSRLRRIRIF